MYINKLLKSYKKVICLLVLEYYSKWFYGFTSLLRLSKMTTFQISFSVTIAVL